MAPPASKVIPGTGFLVDGFKFANPSVRGYFLSHAHSDHFTGLTESWEQGPIYCSEITARLIAHMLCVDKKHLHVLPMNQPQNIDGVEVILVDANHCPGAVQFLFRLPDGRKFVHCGDMRFCPEMLENPFLRRFKGADAIFLDTTYCNPKHTFPVQDESIKYVADTIERCMKEQHEGGPSHLFMVSTYGIGKERIMLEVCDRCDTRICITERKWGVMGCLDWKGPLESIFTTDTKVSSVHVVKWGFLGETWPYFRPNFVNMESARVENGVDKVIGFVPTGWVHTKHTSEFPVRKKGDCEVHLVPYSEHSSYSELRDFVKEMKPEKIIPTVGVNGDDGEKKEASILKHFRNLVNETASKARFIENMQRGSGQPKAFDDKRNECEPSAILVIDMPDETPEKDDSSGPKTDPMEGKRERNQDCGNEMAIDLTLTADLGIGAGAVRTANSGEALETGGLDPEFETPVRRGCKSTVDSDDLTFPQSGGNSFSPKWKHARKSDPQLGTDVHLGNQVPDGGMKDDWKETNSKDPCHGEGVVSSLNSGDGEANAVESEVREKSGVDLMKQEMLETECKDDTISEVGGPSGSIQQGVEINAVHEDIKKKESLVVDGSDLSDQKEGLSQVLTILSGMVSQRRAESLLREAGGKVEVAINAFYENAEIGKPGNEKTLTQARLSQMAGSKKRPLPKKGNRRAPKKRPRMLVGQRSIRSYFAPKDSISKSQGSVGGGCESKDGNILVQGLKPPGVLGPPEEKAAGSEALKRVPNDVDPISQNPYASDEQEVSLSQADLDDLFSGLDSSGKQIPGAQGKVTAGDIIDDDIVLPVPQGPQPSSKHKVPTSTSKANLGGEAEGTNCESGPLGDAKIDECGEGVKETVLKPVRSYDPVSNACWAKGEPPPYLHLAKALHEVASTTKRLKITDGLTNMFRSVLALSPDHLLETVYLTCGKIAPDHVGGELNVGGNIVSIGISEATGCSRKKLRELYSEKGDLGDVAQACKQSQRLLVTPAPLTIPGVFQSLKQLSLEQGTGSTERRKKMVTAMLRACRECEIKYLVRTLIQNLRIGASWLTVVGALGRAIVVHNEGGSVSKERLDKAAAEVCELYHLCPSFDALVPALVEGGIELAKQRCTLIPGVPVKPMLAKISAGIADALTNVKETPFLAEFKYDGVRAQIHIDKGGEVSIFSRRCETKTEAYPDVVSAIKECVGSNVSSIILDAELVAVDRAKGNRLKSFQELSHRGRAAIEESEVTISVCTFVFDILYLNGEVLLKQPLRKRRAAMEEALSNLKEGFVSVAESMEMRVPAPAVTSSNAGGGGNGVEQSNSCGSKSEIEQAESEVREFLVGALSRGAEGLMLKLLDGPSAGYESSKRSDHWLKIKSDYCEGLHDSLDVVPIGAWQGQGRKVKWYSPFLLAVWDPGNEEFQSICRCMSGFSDAFYEEATARLSQKAIPGPKSYYRCIFWSASGFFFDEELPARFLEEANHIKLLTPIPPFKKRAGFVYCLHIISGWCNRTEIDECMCDQKAAMCDITCRTQEQPSTWFEPSEVWEIKGADLTVSPVHQAALGRVHESKGCGLRFPRFIKVREDKGPMDATTADVVEGMFLKQSRRVDWKGEENMDEKDSSGKNE